MATKSEEMSNPNGCLNRAKLDEPIFVLRANDPLAAALVREWAKTYLVSKCWRGEFKHLEITKFADAMKIADDMDKWSAGNADR